MEIPRHHVSLLRTSYKKINLNVILTATQILDPADAIKFYKYFSEAEIKYEISLRTLPSPFPPRFGCPFSGFYGNVIKFNKSTRRKEREYYKIPCFRPIYIITLEQCKYRISKRVLRSFISQIDSVFDGNILVVLYWKRKMRFAFIKDRFILSEWREEKFLTSFDEYDMKLCDQDEFWKKMICKAYGIDPMLLNKKSNVELIFDGLHDEEILYTAINTAKESWGANDRDPLKQYRYAWKRPFIRPKNIKTGNDSED